MGATALRLPKTPRVLASTLLQTSLPAPSKVMGSVTYRAKIVSNYYLPLALSVTGFLFNYSNSPNSGLMTSSNRSNTRAKFFAYKLSFFSKTDLKRILLKKPSLLKLLNSFRRTSSLTELDFFTDNFTANSPLRKLIKAPLLGSKFLGFGLDQVRVSMMYLQNTDPHSTPRSKEVLLKRVRFKPGYQRV
jgi:hypothetical protein